MSSVIALTIATEMSNLNPREFDMVLNTMNKFLIDLKLPEEDRIIFLTNIIRWHNEDRKLNDILKSLD